jgi:hypothetical protein
MLLHSGDVGVRLLDDQSRGDAELRVVADVPIHHQHVPRADVVVLHLGHPGVFGAGDGLVGVLFRGVGGDECGELGAGDHAGADVHVLELGEPGVWHLLGELAQLLGAGIPDDRFRFHREHSRGARGFRCVLRLASRHVRLKSLGHAVILVRSGFLLDRRKDRAGILPSLRTRPGHGKASNSGGSEEAGLYLKS